MVEYIHTLCCLGLRGARFGTNSLPEVSGRYLHISTREKCLRSKEPKPAWAAHEKRLARERKIINSSRYIPHLRSVMIDLQAGQFCKKNLYNSGCGDFWDLKTTNRYPLHTKSPNSETLQKETETGRLM